MRRVYNAQVFETAIASRRRPVTPRRARRRPPATPRADVDETRALSPAMSDAEIDDFDPTLAKKKKSKKKVTLDLGSDDDVAAATEGVDDLNLGGGGDDDDEGFGKKKKKSSKKSKELDLGDDAGESSLDLEGEFGSKKKKSSKKKKALEAELGLEDEDDGASDAAARDGTKTGSGTSWDGTTRDYHYDELLGRVFGILREKNPALGEKSKTIIKPPQVLREGTKKTVFANLMEICNAMHRPSEHVTQYLLAELGTSGTLDGQQRLVLKGRFLPKVFEGVLRHYFIDYVICNMCKSSDTQLVKEQASRLSYCRCQSCGASRSVGAIQKGFAAVQKGERRKARQATG